MTVYSFRDIWIRLRGLRLTPRYRYGRGGGIVFLTHRDQTFMHLNLLRRARPARFAISDYPRLKFFGRLKASVVVFCDVELMTAEEEERLARLAASWAATQSPPIMLNRPPKPQRRYSLLKTLYQRGVNNANIFRLDDPESLDKVRFPCFIRAENSHLFGDAPKLLFDRGDIVSEMDRMKQNGLTTYGKVLCEFEETGEENGRYVKYSYFKVGGSLIAAHRYEGEEWFLKHYTDDYIEENPESLLRERDFLTEQPYQTEVEMAFDIANIDYGRIDFGKRQDGGIHVYEINTNPTILHINEIHPKRRELAAPVLDAIIDAFSNLASDKHASVLHWPKRHD